MDKYYKMPIRTIYIVPKTVIVNGKEYVTYHWQGAEYAKITNLSANYDGQNAQASCPDA